VKRYSIDLLIRHIAILPAVVQEIRKRWSFNIDAWAVLPEHIHCVWILPVGEIFADHGKTAWSARCQ
jgi:putative transposase